MSKLILTNIALISPKPSGLFADVNKKFQIIKGYLNMMKEGQID